MPTAKKRAPGPNEAPYPPAPDPGEHVGPDDPVSAAMRDANEEPTEIVMTPMPITSTDKDAPPPLPIAGPGGVVLSASEGLGRFHQIITTDDVEALKAIAVAAHEVAQAGGLSTNDRRIAGLHGALMAALYST